MSLRTIEIHVRKGIITTNFPVCDCNSLATVSQCFPRDHFWILLIKNSSKPTRMRRMLLLLWTLKENPWKQTYRDPVNRAKCRTKRIRDSGKMGRADGDTGKAFVWTPDSSMVHCTGNVDLHKRLSKGIRI